ncbi:polysaccharide deacetylase family protein [Acetivibrio mesophilus]|uniref:Polysaccharide deacetylase n=1 Tax=Acetivibrio mesophilus TaxID=2487273 RepID=A0A4Q0I4J2_9FIRM|nr:polysaccharide deacetylase family protein [Acetivibrio mesophilus]ODM25985.1 polysaccharide deacetylase [Clostridium sp. Bc-iso-3]RXE59220.1 polysaccharide deacetylase [Acetivibrio mesophilus]HHV29234.1 polysaccharide deacetylase family protein [Clostridium sp.]
MTSFFRSRIAKIVPVIALSLSLLLTGCNSSPKLNDGLESPIPNTSGQDVGQGDNSSAPSTPTPTPIPQPTATIDVQSVKPNEVGKIMVVMFHNFVESFTPTSYDNGEYTTTFSEFEKLLQSLYDDGYRLISMNDYLNNNISVPAGCIPIIFTFDDGTAGQFNLIEENGTLKANKKSAVGIMEEFYEKHPDFGLKGTFYVNLGNSTFDGKGTLGERLNYLVDKGFEIGNHTYTHINLKNTTSADKIQEEIGNNQKTIAELVPGYKMTTFSLPYGLPSKDLQNYVQKGAYEGVEYEHAAIMEVGWDPAHSPASKDFTPLSTHRVRASGINPVECDLAWWIKNLSRKEQYVSDGNPDTITVPQSMENKVDKDKLKDKELIIY